MRRAVLAVVLLAATVRADPLELLRGAAADYRDGRWVEALRGAALVLEDDPANPHARNLIWSIAKDEKKRSSSLTLRPKEIKDAHEKAVKYLSDRRVRTEKALSALGEVERTSRDLRSPAGLLTALEGLNRSGVGGVSGWTGEAVEVRFSTVLRNLNAALEKQKVSSRKDEYRIKGYLAYFKNDWGRAADYWTRALKEDPQNVQVQSELASLRELLRKKQEREELDDLVRQAETYFETGLFSQSVEAWGAVLKINPSFPGAKESLSMARVSREKSLQREKLHGMMERASAEHRAGRAVEAAEICLEALQINPSYGPARALLKLAGKKILEIKSAPPAPSAASPSLVPQDRAKAEPLYKKGLLLYSDGDVAGAVAMWKKAMALDGTFSKAREALRQGESELAILGK